MKFINFSKAVTKQYNLMVAMGELYYVQMDRDELYNVYLESFPEGSNPIFKKRSEHDCNCCKQFIRNTGHVVSIKNGVVHSIWDVDIGNVEPEYQIVADACSAHVKSKAIEGIFRSPVKRIGTPKSVDKNLLNKWDHFFYDLPDKYVLSGISIAQFNGEANASLKLLLRGVTEITSESCDIVHDLIKQKTLYRGEEFLSTVKLAKECIEKYNKAENKNMWLVTESARLGMTGRFKNSVMGTLLVDLSSGVDLDDAVKIYESKVAPSNYKRPTALVTQKMINDASLKIQQLGLTDSIERRCAVAEDITINNVLFADRNTKTKMGVNVLDSLVPTATTKKNKLDKVQEVTIDKFIKDIVPTATSLHIQVGNNQLHNFMSLVAPVHKDSTNLFKWDNNFSFSYKGEVADSMKERVKAAGGNTDGVLRFTIQWNESGDNQNDYDAHCEEPNGNHIWFSNKGRRHPSSGMLDVDIINPGNKVAVENIIYTDINKLHEGVYKFYVNLYSHRGGVGFDAEIEFDGVIYPISCTKPMRSGENFVVAKVQYSKKEGFKMLTDLQSTSQSKEIWGVQTNDWVKVNMLMNSPNHWDGNCVGNKHWFFILENCKNPDNIRGFYNEFLRDDLTQHRKVFELLSSKFKVTPVDNQLSGVGFSSTKSDTLLCKVGGTFDRVIKIKF